MLFLTKWSQKGEIMSVRQSSRFSRGWVCPPSARGPPTNSHNTMSYKMKELSYRLKTLPAITGSAIEGNGTATVYLGLKTLKWVRLVSNSRRDCPPSFCVPFLFHVFYIPDGTAATAVAFVVQYPFDATPSLTPAERYP